MPAIDFGDRTITSTDSNFVIPLGKLHINTWINAFTRQASHVFGNEALAKASEAKRKAGGELDDDERNAIILEAREKLLESMIAGTWGDRGTRGPRMPAANRLEALFNLEVASDSRSAMSKRGYKAGEEKDTWVVGDKVYTLAQAMQSFLENDQYGVERRESCQKRAQARYDAELAVAAEKKAKREREANGGKPDEEGSELAL